MEDEVANVSLCQTNPFDEDFLRDILQQPEAEAYAIGSSIFGHNHTHTNPSPTTYILSFDKSTALLPNDANNNWTHQLPKQSRANQGTKKTRTASESLDHIMSERNRRQELTRKFIALASTIPGLKKMDKAHVLREAMNYVNQLQERVEELEEDMEKKGVEAAITITRSHLRIDECDEALPEVEARVLGKEVLIKIHCTKQNGILLKIMSRLERLHHLFISTTNVLPFGNTLDITIIAQIADKYNLVVKDLVKDLRQVAVCDVEQ